MKNKRIETPTSWWERVKFFFKIQRYLLPFWPNVVLRLTLGPFVSMLMLLGAFVNRYAFNEVFPKGDMRGWMVCAAIVFMVPLLARFLEFLLAVLAQEMTTRQEMCLRDRMFSHVMRLSLRFHGRRPIGENVFRLLPGDVSKFLIVPLPVSGQDAADAVGLCATIPVELMRHLIQIAMVLGAMSMVSMKIAFLILAYVVGHVLVTHWLMSHLQRANRASREARQGVESRARESLTLFAITKAFARQAFENTRFYRAAAYALRRNLRAEVWTVFFDSIAIHSAGVFLLFLDLIVGLDILAGKGDLTPGDFALFPPLVITMLMPVSFAIRSIQDIRLRFVAADRVLETLNAEPEIIDTEGAVPLHEVRGAVEFQNVTFGYDPAKPVLHDISFRVEAGKKVAFVGPSGAGKTSIVNLLMRFYDPAHGRVFVDGKDIGGVYQRDLRRRIGMVLQDSILFSGTIADNIRYGKPDATMKEVIEAARIADIHDFIETLPAKYETKLSETEELSGGQKQRIAIARAVIREPRILVLDEATAAVDPIVEREVITALNAYAKDRTVLVIAHDLINVRDADEIIVLEQGRIVQRGSHPELMADKDGLYRTMWLEEEAGSA